MRSGANMRTVALSNLPLLLLLRPCVSGNVGWCGRKETIREWCGKGVFSFQLGLCGFHFPPLKCSALHNSTLP